MLGSAIAALAATRPGAAEGLTKLRFCGSAAVPRVDQGFMFLRTPPGFFAGLGIDPDFVSVAGSGATIQLVAANQVQFGHVGMLELMAAKKRNPTLPVRAVYLQEVGSGYEVVVPDDSKIATAADLRGKSVGILSAGSGAIPFLKAMIVHAGLKPDDIDLLPVGVGAQALAALRSNRIQALSLFRGSHAAIENLGVKFRYLTIPLPSSVLAVNEGVLAQQQDAIVRALQAVVLNSVYMETNPVAGARAAWDVIGAPPDPAAQIDGATHLVTRASELWNHPGSGRPWGFMDDATWTGIIDYLGPHSDVDLTGLDLSTVYTNALTAAVNRVDINPAIEAARKA
jgi:NitT/TauT family transport system substrate-binding protein